MTKQISEERKKAYYFGMGMIVTGCVLFVLSAILTIGSVGQGFYEFHAVVQSLGAETGNMQNNGVSGFAPFKIVERINIQVIFGMGMAFVGGLLIIIGAVTMKIAARGLAGTGIILDPERAREELEPYSRMAGGMVKDALDEAKVSFGSKSEKVVMVKCRNCGKLNPEDAKFCNGCGREL